MSFFKFYVMFSCQRLLPPPESSTSFKSTPAYFFTASTMVIRSNGFPRSISTPLYTILVVPQNFLCHMTVQILCQIHHAVIICICLIQLHQGKFRIVSGIQTFITEYTSNLINSFQAADDQSLQVQFQRDTQFYIFVQCIEMCLKRSCCSTTCILLPASESLLP